MTKQLNTELTDLEICKRIAEIEGLEVDKESPSHEEPFYLISSASKWMIDSFGLDKNCISFTFNPLTDKALCFDLMVKHGIDFYTPSTAGTEPNYTAEHWESTLGANNIISIDASPQRAICLAIIAKEDNK